jgi:TetR/AcrR family tetracycline transcriptional repressor
MQEPNHIRAKGGRPRSLTEDQILEAALRLAASVGLENVSMRRLAQELHAPVMTIYNYVPSKEALNQLVVDFVLRSVRVPSADEGTWEDRLKQLERDARSALAKIPGLTLERSDSAEGARLADGVRTILASAGLDATAASLAFAVLFTFMIGQIDIDVGIAEAGGPAVEAVESAARSTRLSQDEIFEFGFEALIEGLKLKLGLRPGTGVKSREPRSR